MRHLLKISETPHAEPRLRPITHLSLRWLIPLAVLGASLAPQVRAQPADGGLPPLAQFIPDDARLFVEIDGLLNLGISLRERNLWPVLEGLLGADSPDGGWPAALAANLGIDSTGAMLRLFGQRVALAAPDWRNLGAGVIVFTNASPRSIEVLFRRAGAGGAATEGQVRVVRSRGGMWLANLGSTVVLGRDRGPDSMFDRAVALLPSPGPNSLAAAAPFRECLADLPGPRLVWAYWAGASGEGPAENTLTGWWPNISQGALAVKTTEGELQIALRGLREGDSEAPYQPRVKLERLLMLPQLTLAAWATSVDARELYASARAAEPPAEYAAIWRLLTEQADGDAFAEQVVSKIGPRCIICFSANFHSPALSPQLALLIESVDANAVVTALQEHAARIAASAGPDSALAVGSEDYTGVPIHTLSWPRTEGGDTLAALMIQDVSPAAAALDGWVVLSTSSDLIHDIIDARSGLTQRLADVLPEDRGALRRAGSVAVLQPVLAQSMLRYWGAMLDLRRAEEQSRARLGISVQAEPVAGAVVVESVDSNGPAAAVLEAGDRILGCGETLLSMDDALGHLRTLVAASKIEEPLRLRVLRGDEILEAPLTLPPIDQPRPQGLSALFHQLGPLEGLILNVSSAILTVERPTASGYRAEVTLLLQPQVRPPTPGPTPPAEIPPE